MTRRISTLTFLALLFLGSSVHAALNGVYTINSGLPATAANYLTFTSAVSDMVSGTRADGGPVNGSAVSGPVTFNVAAGTFNERISIPAITGASAVNTITFNGAGPLLSTITFASSTVNDYTIQLNGADFIRLTNLGIRNTGVTYGYGVQLINNAENNIISGCNISTPVTSTSYYHCGIIAGTYYSTLGVNTSNLSILNNTISGGRFSVIVNGTSGTMAQGVVISGNTSTDCYFVALYLQYLNGAQVTGNNITLRANYTGSYGSQIRYSNAVTYDRNKIINAGLYGAYFIGNNSTGSAFTTISNNMIGGGFQSTGTSYGLYLTSCGYMRIYHNSILCDNPGTGGRPLYIASSTSNIEILNNVFSAVATNGTSSYAAYITSTTGITMMNHNLYHSNGTQLVFFGANFATLAALQAGAPSFNANSQSGPPSFTGSTDLHTFGSAHANWGTLTLVNTDFDLQTRPLAPDLTPDVGADEFVLTPIDPDLLQIVSPVVGAVGSNTVSALVQNNGGSSLNGASLTLEYSTDGGTTWPVAQTFTPTTLATPGSQQTFIFSTPWNIPAGGTYTVCVRINPNMPGDPDPVTQICTTICTGLSGTYTINNTLATGGTNYNNFTDASAALSSCGILGPTTFNVAAGNYAGGFTIGTVLGTSASSRVIFDGGAANLVNLDLTSSVANSSIVKLDNADFITFKNMTLNVLGIYGFCFHLSNQANYNIIEDCRLLMSANTSSAYQIGVVMSGATYSTTGDHANHTIIRNNYIRGGYYGLRFNGTSTTILSTSNQVIGNTIEDYYYYGIYSTYQKAPRFDGNTIQIRTTGTVTTVFGYGMYLNVADSSFSISNNSLPIVGGYGVYLTGGNRTNMGKGRIENNMIGGGFQTTGTAYGIYMTSSRDIDILHNSLHIGSHIGNGLYVVGAPPTTDSLRIRNNIFSAGTRFGGSGGVPMRVASNNAVQQMNHNLYHAVGTTLVDYGGVQYPNLAALQSAYPAFNASSVSGYPGFRTDIDLHIICSDYDNLGSPIGVLTDIDTDARSVTTPDIGADEFNALTISYSLGPDSAHCGRLYMTADTNAFEMFYWGGLQLGATTYFDTTGTYHVTVIDSNNCLASDTINITILDFPIPVYEGDTVALCAYDSLNVLNPGSSFLWSTGDTTPVIFPGTAGVYTASITSQDGCNIGDTVTVTLYSAAVANLGADTTFCNGGGYLLDAGAGPTGTTYQWNTGSTTQVVLVSAAGWFSVSVLSPNGCFASDSVFMNVLQPPVVNLGPNRFECDQFTLDGGTGGVSYLWSNNANTQTITTNVSGQYSVTVTSANGCATTDQVQVTVSTTPTVNLGPDPVLCDGSTATFNAGNPGFDYMWSTGQTTQSITVSLPGTYLVNVIDPVSQCTGTDTVEAILSNLDVELGPNFSLCIGDQGVLDAGTAATSYLWSTGDLGQFITVSQPGAYSVQITDALGCIAQDSILVSVQSRPTVAFTGPATVPLLQPAQFNDGSSVAVTSWLWDFGDGQTSIAQNPIYVYQAMGTFNVCLTASNGVCDSTFCQTIVVGAPVEVEDEVLSANTTVFPNPSAGNFQVAFDLPYGLDLELEVCNMAGQRLLARALTGVRTRTEYLDLTMYPDGVYFLRARSTKGHLMISKLVKQ